MKKLHPSLNELKKEIGNTPVADEAGKAKLSDLNEKIDLVLEDSSSIPGEHHASLLKSLREAILHFEVTHPKLTSYINRIAGMLADMGI